ncbi:MAG: preprotein translocase subunit SecY [Oscillospiraceae bacterium]|nr:preprotein translocase subunit SecY [Oscillospiraceae bacterium]
MLATLRNAWKIDDIRKKLLFMMFMVLIYRLGNAVTVPYVNAAELTRWFQRDLSGSILGLINTMSGSALERASIFALSIQPYINASIIMQLLTIAIPALERMRKEGGEEGKKKIEKITRYSTIGIAALQGFAYYTMISGGDGSGGSMLVDGAEGWLPAVVIVATFMTGSALLMWMGEQITEFGIGNGISIILFVSIVSRFPNEIYQMVTKTIAAPSNWWIYALMLLGALAIVVLIVIVQNSERRIPVQYSKRVVGRKMYGGQSTHLPMKVNMSGVLPVIFAQSIASIPATVGVFIPGMREGWLMSVFDTDKVTYMVIYFLLIVFFSYFYSTVQFNPVEIANNLKKNGGFIPGFRAGKPTSEFIQKVLTKITLFGALFLAVVAISPIIVSAVSQTAKESGISMGGTSIIIVVSVAIETIKQLESQMLMRHYKGFLE